MTYIYACFSDLDPFQGYKRVWNCKEIYFPILIVSWVSICLCVQHVKSVNAANVLDTINVIKIQSHTLHNVTTCWALPVHTSFHVSFSHFNNILRSANWKFWFSRNFIWLLITSARSQMYHYSWFVHVFKGDDWHVLWFNQQQQQNFILRHCLNFVWL